MFWTDIFTRINKISFGVSVLYEVLMSLASTIAARKSNATELHHSHSSEVCPGQVLSFNIIQRPHHHPTHTLPFSGSKGALPIDQAYYDFVRSCSH